MASPGLGSSPTPPGRGDSVGSPVPAHEIVLVVYAGNARQEPVTRAVLRHRLRPSLLKALAEAGGRLWLQQVTDPRGRATYIMPERQSPYSARGAVETGVARSVPPYARSEERLCADDRILRPFVREVEDAYGEDVVEDVLAGMTLSEEDYLDPLALRGPVLHTGVITVYERRVPQSPVGFES